MLSLKRRLRTIWLGRAISEEMEWVGRVVAPNGGGEAYAVVDDVLVSCIVVNVDCDAAKGGDFGGELGEAAVVLSGGWWLGDVRRWGVGRDGEGRAGMDVLLAVVCCGHDGWLVGPGRRCESVCVGSGCNVVVGVRRDACGGYVLKLHACVH